MRIDLPNEPAAEALMGELGMQRLTAVTIDRGLWLVGTVGLEGDVRVRRAA